jgi:hypothetical protein
VYGNKYAVVLMERDDTFRFVVFKSANLAEAYQANFMSLWDSAPPLLVQVTNKAHRTEI